jgi:hypothetical protein
MTTAAERESRQLAEASREKTWHGESFIRELFLGRFRFDLVDPFPLPRLDRPAFQRFHAAFRDVLENDVDPIQIDTTGEYPEALIARLAEIGAFGMKIPEEYGGLGLTHPEYVAAMKLCGSYDGNVTALLSAHQAIGVPQPVKLFGTEEQKRRFLPRCARGAISAFALTEPAVGSDPARLSSTAEASPDGSHFVLNGTKLWCTNATLAELLVVMARDPLTNRINTFVVETDAEGVEIERCHFMGLRALANGQVHLRDVKVPRENLIGEEGDGLRIALVTLNTGRLSLPAATAGTVKACLELCRKWCQARVQWGRPIGEHEAIAHHLADMAAIGFAMESLADLVGDLAERDDVDIRLEAAAAKEWNTSRGWEQVDAALQVRGGRGFETESSLAARGEPPTGTDRMLRDSRVNRIFEGSNEIMHLFMAREAVDPHLEVAGALIDPDATWADKLRALPGIVRFYAVWVPSCWIGWGWWPRYREYGRCATHLRFADRHARKLARQLFHGMLVYRGGLERRQAFLFRAVDVAMELFVLAATVSHARALRDTPQGESAEELADLVARGCRRRTRRWLRALWLNHDARKYRVGRGVLAGRHAWLEDGIMPLGYEAEELAPPSVKELLQRRDAERPSS